MVDRSSRDDSDDSSGDYYGPIAKLAKATVCKTVIPGSNPGRALFSARRSGLGGGLPLSPLIQLP